MNGGMSESNKQPDAEQGALEAVLASLCHLQKVLPEAVLVGGTAAALYAKHRFSFDHDHVIPDLQQRFDTVLTELEAVARWETARVKRPVVILGSLDGVETGVRQLRPTQAIGNHCHAGGQSWGDTADVTGSSAHQGVSVSRSQRHPGLS
jgi:hypothetical protein